MYREEGERGYKCCLGGGRGYLRGPEGGHWSGGHHREGMGYRWAEEGLPCLGSFHSPFHLQAGGSFLATFPILILSIKLSHNLGTIHNI